MILNEIGQLVGGTNKVGKWPDELLVDGTYTLL